MWVSLERHGGIFLRHVDAFPFGLCSINRNNKRASGEYHTHFRIAS